VAVRVSGDWSYNGVPAVIMDNGLIRAVLLPELGGKLWQLTYLPRSRDLLWQHPRLKARPVPFNSVYDDVFFGGWDELFPNDMPEEVAGEPLPDHGELWTLPWECAVEEASPSQATVHLWVETPITACRMDRWVTLREGELRLRFLHRLANQGGGDVPYLWKLHAAVRLEEGSLIELGARAMYVEDFGSPRNGRTGAGYTWPHLTGEDGTVHDMRQTLPASARVSEFQYGTELERGWCAIRHPAGEVGLGIAFDPAVFRSCWTFASYGGWRNLHVLVLEPCTGYPVSVAAGVDRGTHRVLRAGEVVETEASAIILGGER
jgi:hypothetical protein